MADSKSAAPSHSPGADLASGSSGALKRPKSIAAKTSDTGEEGVSSLDRLAKKAQALVADANDDDDIIVVAQAWLANKLTNSRFGFANDAVQTIFSFLACGMYIVATYLEAEGELPWWMFVFEWLAFVVFTVDYIMHLFVAENKCMHFFSRTALVDLASILPIISLYIDTSIGFLRILRLFRIFRVMRSFSAPVEGTGGEDGPSSVSRQVGVLFFKLIAIVFIGAGIVHSVELWFPGSYRWVESLDCVFDRYRDLPRHEVPPECRMDFIQAAYFVIITVTTVGFGDVIPADNLGRVVILAVLLPLFNIIPHEISVLTELMDKQSKYSAPFRGAAIPHIVVCGDVGHATALAFLQEFFHPDHGDQQMRVVFLSPQEPTPAVEGLLSSPLFVDKTQYVLGTPLSTTDLNRADIRKAAAVFILTSPFKPDVAYRDATAILIVKSIRTVSPWAQVFCQVVNAEARRHEWAQWDHLLCLQELRMGVIAKSAVCPGFSTLISNLIMSSTDFDASRLPRRDRKWTEEYTQGYGQEVYSVEFSPFFSGSLFGVAVNRCYNLFGVCVIGVETALDRPAAEGSASRAPGSTGASGLGGSGASAGGSFRKRQAAHAAERGEDIKQKRAMRLGHVSMAHGKLGGVQEEKRKLLINPKDYHIRHGDKAIIIAEDAEDADKVQTWNGNILSGLAQVLAIDPGDKTTFERLNGGRGPLLRKAKIRIVSATTGERNVIGTGDEEADEDGDDDDDDDDDEDGEDGDDEVGGSQGGARTAADIEAGPGDGMGSSSRRRGGGRSGGATTGESQRHLLTGASSRLVASPTAMTDGLLLETPGSAVPALPASSGMLDAMPVLSPTTTTPAGHLDGMMGRGAMAPRSAAPGRPAGHGGAGGLMRRRRLSSGGGAGPGGGLARYGSTEAARAAGSSALGSHPVAGSARFGGSRLGRAAGVGGGVVAPSSGRRSLVVAAKALAGPSALPLDGGYGPVDDASMLSKHIVICGAVTPDALINLLIPLRAECTTKVVVLHQYPGMPPIALPANVATDIFFLRGSPLVVDDLERAGCGSAMVAIVLANPYTHAAGGDESSESSGSIADLEAVFTTCVIEARFPACRILVEVLTSSSMKFMNYTPASDGLPAELWPQYACGRIYTARALDSLLCQAFYNPPLIPVINKLITGGRESLASQSEDTDGEDSDQESETAAASAAAPASAGTGRQAGDSLSGVVEYCRVIQMQVPLPFVNRLYRDLFMELVLTRNILPIAIYRSNDVHNAVLPYVVANPKPTTQLHPDDRLFVLCGNSVFQEALFTKSWDKRIVDDIHKVLDSADHLNLSSEPAEPAAARKPFASRGAPAGASARGAAQRH
jgi:hypothetical protein